jgi:hypothetical protein
MARRRLQRWGTVLSRSTAGWVTGLVLLASGCAFWEPSARQSVPQQDSASLSSLRPPGPEGQQLGLDARSREIERSLGVR